MPYRSGPLHAPESPRRPSLHLLGLAVAVTVAILGATRVERARRHRAWVRGAGARFAAQVGARTIASGEQLSVLRGEGERAVVVRLPGRLVWRGTDLVRVPEVVPVRDAVALMPGGAWAVDARGNLLDASSAGAVTASAHRPCVASHVAGHGRVVRLGANGVARLADGTFARRRSPSSFDWVAVDARTLAEVVDIDPRPNGIVVPDRRRVAAPSDAWTNDVPLATLQVPDPVEIASSFATSTTCVRGRRGDVRCGTALVFNQGCYALDDGCDELVASSQPIELSPARSARRVAVGTDDVCVIGTDRRLSCGVMPNPLESAIRAARIDLLPVQCLGEVSDVAMTRGARCVLDRAGEVRCWGPALQHGGVVRRDAPVAIEGLDAVERLVSAGPYTCALQRGEVLCWGAPPPPSGEPEAPRGLRPIPGLTPVAELVGSSDRLCVGLRDGGVRCWYGDPLTTPPQVPEWRGPVAVHSLVLVENWLLVQDAGGRAWVERYTATRFELQRAPFWDGFERMIQAFGQTCAIRGGDVACPPMNWVPAAEQRRFRAILRSYLPRLVPAVGHVQPLVFRDHQASDVVYEVDEAVRTLLGGELRAHVSAAWPGAGACGLGPRGQVACRWWASGPGLDESEYARHDRLTADRPAALVPGLDDAVELAMSSGGLACARRASGRVACWGRNVGGLLTPGVSTREPRLFRLDQLLAR